MTKTDSTDFYTAGSSTTYEIVVSNSGPFGVQGAVVDDPLPAGISSASWTCGGATGGGACGQASGSGAISGRTVDLPVGASVTFSMTLQIPAGYSGDLTNIATVTAPGTALETDLTNNSATDVDAGVVVTKTLIGENGVLANLAEPGEQLTYRITVTNNGSVAVSGYDVIDTLDPNTSLVMATGGGILNGSNVEWTNLSIPPGGSLSVLLMTRIDDPLPSTLTRITNIARHPDGPVPSCPSGQCVVTPVAPAVTYAKSTTATNAAVGDVITYTLTARVFHSPTTDDLTLTDTLGSGLDFTAVTNAGAFTCTPGSPLVCTLPSGTAVGTYSLAYTATVNASATGSVTNAVVGTGGDDPSCSGTCDTDTPVVAPDVTFAKSADTAGPVSTGDIITFTLTTTITNSLITSDIVLLTDTLGTGLDFTAVTDAGIYGVDSTGDPVIEFTLPAGTGPGSYSVSYTAIVAPDATGSVSNVVVGSGPDNPTCTTACGTETTVADPVVTYGKSVSAPGATVAVGDVLDYTLSVTVANSPTTGIVTLTDTLGTGLDFTAVTDAGVFTCNAANPLICTLAAGTPVGTYDMTYTATVNDDATGSVTNAVVGTGDDDPGCDGTCDTATNVTPSQVTYAKSTSATNVSVGDTITYTLSATVTNSQTTDDLTLTDTLGTGLDFGSVTNAGVFTCTPGNPLSCTLPAGTAVGTYSLAYTATVNAAATGSVTNAVLGTGGDDPACLGSCDTTTTVDEPAVAYAKFADTAGPVSAGDVITFTLRTTIANSMTTSDIVLLTDTLGAGLDFTAVTDAGAYGVDASGAPVVEFTLPAGTGPGTYDAVYTATVTADASGAVSNAVVGTGGDDATCSGDCDTDTSVVAPGVTYAKTASTAGPVSAGDVITYTISTIVANSQTTGDVVLADTLGSGLDFTAVTDAGAYGVDASGAPVVEFTLPAGTAPGTYEVSYTATVNGSASGSVSNAVVGTGDDDPTCTVNCGTQTAVEDPTVTYTLSATVANAATNNVLTLTDTLGTGLDFGSVTDAGAFTCTPGNPLVCTLPAGTAPGTYSLTYNAEVNASATGSVNNAVLGTGGDDPACLGDCNIDTPVIAPAVSYAKTASTAGPVSVGDVISFTLTTTIANSMTTSDLVLLTDTLGTGLDFTAVTDAGAYGVDASGAPVVRFTLPAGTGPGSYAVTYTATVNGSASGSVSNVVVGSGGDNPVCTVNCGTETTVEDSTVTYSKSSSAAQVQVGDSISYTLTATVGNSALTDALTLTDTLGTGLDFVAITDAGVFTCTPGNPLVCTLPAGTAPGTYSLAYTATVNAAAGGSVTNAVLGTGGDDPACLGDCITENPVAAPVISIAKTSDPAAGETVQVGQTVNYALVATIANGAITAPLVLVDTPDPGLTITDIPAGCEMAGGIITCTLPAGTPAGTHSLAYGATINDSAGDAVRNVVTATGGGGTTEPGCNSCATEHNVALPLIRLAKTAAVREVRIGDLVRYTLSIENVGERDLIGGSIMDMPPAGFTYVEGSLQVVDGDNAATLSGQGPLRFGEIDVRAGETATLAYLMRVGAGVRPGTHVNQAQAYSAEDVSVSNPATARVELAGDPLVDETLIFGTLFDDRDGDGWQDSAALSGLHVRGGFAPGAYVPGSTMIDRGQGMVPVPDASAPLLHGMDLGGIAARQSEADPAGRNRIVIRQRLTDAAFTDDFILTSAQGVTIRMDAQGRTSVEKGGDAAKGLNGAEPRVERRIAQGEGGHVVDYVIENDGIDERGIPGVRIASVEGLVMETDQFGRYHLAAVPGGAWARGRNFILKVDPSTLPDGAEFTTDNPLLRRITPGIPVRFDWGVKLPPALVEGRTETVELELGQAIFTPGSAEIRAEYLPAIDRMAAEIGKYQGGEIVIEANGENASLAFDRAEAVKTILLRKLDTASARNLAITARGRVDDPSSLIAGVDEGGVLLGTVLFDTDSAQIRPEFAPLLGRVAARLAREGGGAVAIIGHTDLRGSFQYNTALGMRRARAVYEALASQLPPDIRAKIRVDSSEDPAAPADGQAG
nr:OmpA family protein [Croceibacterium atlanticum]